MPSKESLSFCELDDANNKAPPSPKPDTVVATNGIKLAVRVYQPPQPCNAILVFLHGAGAHSAAGYQHIGQGLSKEYGIAVYMPDLRGHGASGGPRGDAPCTEQVFQDVNTILSYARTKAHSTTLPIFLGGHSSGGGLVVNYSNWAKRQASISGYLLLAPQLGYLSKTARPEQKYFVSVNILPFIVNGMTGWMGHSKAVRFHYSSDILADAGMVSYNTVHMANAITPTAPQDQFRAITNLPLGLWVGADDELFLADKVADFTNQIENPRDGTCGIVVEGENHLGILVNAHRYIGPWIAQRVQNIST